MMKVKNIKDALTRLAVSGHSSRRRVLATVVRLGGCFIDARVYNGMKRCRLALTRKSKLNPMNTNNVLFRAMTAA